MNRYIVNHLVNQNRKSCEKKVKKIKDKKDQIEGEAKLRQVCFLLLLGMLESEPSNIL